MKDAIRLMKFLAFSVSGLKIWKQWPSPSMSTNSTSPFHPLFFNASEYKTEVSLISSFSEVQTSNFLHPIPDKLGGGGGGASSASSPVDNTGKGFTIGLSIPPGADG